MCITSLSLFSQLSRCFFELLLVHNNLRLCVFLIELLFYMQLLDHTKPVPDVCLQMEPGRCCIMTQMLGRYMLVGQPVMVPRGPLSHTGTSALVPTAKMLRLAVFVPRVPAQLDFNVRVYFVEDTPDALEVCMTSRVCNLCR